MAVYMKFLFKYSRNGSPYKSHFDILFIFYALGTLFWGPMSDKYGRKPVLLAGLAMYTVASILCAFAGDVYQLIIFRIIQAVGSGAAIAVSTAIVKDVYSGRKRESVLAVVQSMGMTAPIVAPVIGAIILKFTSWRGVFFTLAAVGLIAIVIGLLLQETIDKHYSGSIFQSIGRLGVVLKNKGFASLLVTGIQRIADEYFRGLGAVWCLPFPYCLRQ